MIQALFIISCLLSLYNNVTVIYGAQIIISFVMVCYVINRHDTNPAYKLSWTILILLFPIVGAFMYIFLHAQLGTMFFRNTKNQIYLTYRFSLCRIRTCMIKPVSSPYLISVFSVQSKYK